VDDVLHFWEFDKRVDDLSKACAVPDVAPAYLVDYHAGLANATFCPELLSTTPTY
ncbi:unnamed protein product, partial [Amoebophrya sp. A25]